jgi:hypothetical protein
MKVIFYLFGERYELAGAFDDLLASSKSLQPLLAYNAGEIWAISLDSGVPAKVAEYREQKFWTWESEDGKENTPGWYHPVRGGREPALPFNPDFWAAHAVPKTGENLTKY